MCVYIVYVCIYIYIYMHYVIYIYIYIYMLLCWAGQLIDLSVPLVCPPLGIIHPIDEFPVISRAFPHAIWIGLYLTGTLLMRQKGRLARWRKNNIEETCRGEQTGVCGNVRNELWPVSGVYFPCRSTKALLDGPQRYYYYYYYYYYVTVTRPTMSKKTRMTPVQTATLGHRPIRKSDSILHAVLDGKRYT